jgi:hypothetical protein
MMKESMKDPKDIRVLRASTYLQRYYAQFLYCEVYWLGQSGMGRCYISIVINTGAFISLSRIKLDFFDGIIPVEPDLKIHGSLNQVSSQSKVSERTDEK